MNTTSSSKRQPRRPAGGSSHGARAGRLTTQDEFLSHLRVQFPDAQANPLRHNIEVVLKEVSEFRDLRVKDHDQVRTQVDKLQFLSGALGDQLDLPVEALVQGFETVALDQRKARRIAEEEMLIRGMSPQFGHGSVRTMNPSGSVVEDEPGEKKIRLLMEMLTQSTAEVARLREELALAAHQMALKDDRIIELAATVHGTNLSMSAMELAMTKLKRKAAVGGGGGGFRSSSAVSGATPGAIPGAEGGDAQSAAAASAADSNGGGGFADKASNARRSIAAERRRFVAYSSQAIQVDAAGQDFGPKGKMAMVVVRVPHLPAVAARFPALVPIVLDNLRDSVHNMLEAADGFEFRQWHDLFACAFDDCTGALDFALNFTTHVHNTSTWPKELELMDEFRTVASDTGISVFRGLCVSIGVHAGHWSGSVDLLTQRKLYAGELFDKTVAICRSCPAGLVFMSTEVLVATGTREFLTEKGAVLTAITPWGVHVVLPAMLKDRTALAKPIPDAPLARPDLAEFLQTLQKPQPAPTEPRAIVVIQVEGFLSTIIEGDVPQRELFQAAAMLRRFIRDEMRWSSVRGATPAVIVRQEGADKFVVAFDSVMDAVDFSLALQTDLLCLPWKSAIVDAGIGLEEQVDVPEGHKLALRATVAPPLLTFRGLRLQVGVHVCKAAPTPATDLFSQQTIWSIPEINVPTGLSVLARGGEIILSEAARDALYDEQRRFKDDCRVADAVLRQIPKRIVLPGFADGIDAYFVGNHTTVYRFRDAFPLAMLDTAPMRIAQYGLFRAPRLTAAQPIGFLAIAIGNAPVLRATDGAAFLTVATQVRRLVEMITRRFDGIECAVSDDPPADAFVVAFPNPVLAAHAAQLCHELALEVSMTDVLRETLFSQTQLGTDGDPIYRGPRLKIGYHVGHRAALWKIPPRCTKPQLCGEDVQKSLFLCSRTTAGTTLLSFPAWKVVHSWKAAQQQQLSATSTTTAILDDIHLLELVDFRVEGIGTHPGAFHLMVPRRFKERLLSSGSGVAAAAAATSATPNVAVDAVDTVVNALATQPSMLASFDPVAAIPAAPYDADACDVKGTPQMFVVCRMLGWSLFSERAPQFTKETLKVYLSCVRDTVAALRGKQLDADDDALLIKFDTPIQAVQFAQQVQVSLVLAKWPVEILSTDFGKEVRSTARGGGAGRTGSLFRGPRVLVAMDWGAPKRLLDSGKQAWEFFGEPVQFAIELSHWGHAGMTLLSKRARAAIAQELTVEATRQMVENPSIVSLGTRNITVAQAPTIPALSSSQLQPQFGGGASVIVVDPSEGEQIFALVPLVFFERHFPTFPEFPNDERRFTKLTNRMAVLAADEPDTSVSCLVVHVPAHEPAPLSSSPPPEVPDASTAVAATSANHAAAESSTETCAKPTTVASMTFSDEHFAATAEFLHYFRGRAVRSLSSGMALQFPTVTDALLFGLCFSSTGPKWARECVFAVDTDALESSQLGTLVAPFGTRGEVILSEESLRMVTSAQASKLFQGFVLARHRTPDAIPVDDIETPPLRLVSLCALRLSAACASSTADTPAAVWANESVDALVPIPGELWMRPPEPTTTKGTDGAVGSGDGNEAAGGHPENEGQPGGDEAQENELQITAPFERTAADSDFLDAIRQLTAPANRASTNDTGETAVTAADGAAARDPGATIAALESLWNTMRQRAAEDERRVQCLTLQVQELNAKLERLDGSQRQGLDLMTKSHRVLRLYRSRLDAFFKKAMVEEVVYGNDADLFVADWIGGMKTTQAGDKTLSATGGTATTGGGSSSLKKHAMTPREEFSTLMRQAIEDDGNESRANPNRLYVSLVGHLSKVFSGIEKLLKQRERISRLGAVMHRKPQPVRYNSPPQSQQQPQQGGGSSFGERPPSSATSVVGGGGTTSSDATVRRRFSSVQSTERTDLAGGSLSPDDRRKSMRTKIKSMLVLRKSTADPLAAATVR